MMKRKAVQCLRTIHPVLIEVYVCCLLIALIFSQCTFFLLLWCSLLLQTVTHF